MIVLVLTPNVRAVSKRRKRVDATGTLTPDAEGWGCFSARATVQVLDQSRQNGISSKPMADVAIGDLVRTADNAFEPVYAFGHFNTKKVADFVQIYTKGNKKPLEMTYNHLIFVADKTHPVTAGSLKVGNFVHVDSSDTPVAVSKIKSVVRKTGVFAPLTPSGTILVDGVLASTYVSMQKPLYSDDDGEYARMADGMHLPLISQQQGIHMATSFFRMMCMGVTSVACGNPTVTEGSEGETIERDGLVFWADYGIRLATFAQTKSVPVQWILLVFALLVVTPIYTTEMTFGAKYAPLAVFAITIAGLFVAKQNRSKSFEMSKKTM